MPTLCTILQIYEEILLSVSTTKDDGNKDIGMHIEIYFYPILSF